MEEEPPIFSSQASIFEEHEIKLPDTNKENVPYSPSRARSERIANLSSQKPKALPTVTPKRFTKFFTPRTLSGRGGRQSKAGRQLRDITKNGANRRRTAPDFARDSDSLLYGTPNKRRKLSLDAPSSPPLRSSPLKHVQIPDRVPVLDEEAASPSVFNEEADLPGLLEHLQPFPKPVRRLRRAGAPSRILERSFGGYDAISRGARGFDHCADWQADTANFVSTPTDVHAFTGTALPFCTASCNTNSLVAIGDEEGSVRLIDSAKSSDFSKPHVSFRPHHNAIMDVAFSSDDFLLASASGDQTVRIVDMPTQQTRCILTGHKSSVKQVRFRPGDDNMLTTCGRDGLVQVWDLRCSSKSAVQPLRTSFCGTVDADGKVEPPTLYSKFTLEVGSLHRSVKRAAQASSASEHSTAGVSITSIQHLPNGREHLLLTASEFSASIKLWDLRQGSRSKGSTPLSSTPIPTTHTRTRNFGINALTLSGDGARLYAVCRDSTIYAYSSNHLLLGYAPEMSAKSSTRRAHKDTTLSIEPLYALRHPQLKTGSFYIKAALRPAKADKSEMLAIGSSENCTILFPTDERHLSRPKHGHHDDGSESEDEAELPSLPPLPSSQITNDGSLPVHEHGTALIRAHNKEVTSLTWTHDGELVTISDDFTARCWREDASKARELRACGEGEGRRWGCGWAHVATEWDEEDG